MLDRSSGDVGSQQRRCWIAAAMCRSAR
ncbi:uncharacterized, partial [Tachysurus ichikawai]